MGLSEIREQVTMLYNEPEARPEMGRERCRASLWLYGCRRPRPQHAHSQRIWRSTKAMGSATMVVIESARTMALVSATMVAVRSVVYSLASTILVN